MRQILMFAFLAIVTVSAGSGQTGTADVPTAATGANHYLIGPGDVLDIRVFARPTLSRESVRVDERGMIRLPLIHEISAACKTEADLSETIGNAYLEYLKKPHVEVFIKDYQSKPVVVVGAVRQPGRFQMQRQVSLVEIISLAGGLTENAAGRVQVTHSTQTRLCGSDDTGEQVEWYDMEDLLAENKGGNAAVPVRAGDTINLLEANKAYVIGHVMKPSTVSLKEDITVSQAIAMAGGTAPDAKPDRVRVIRHGADGARGEIVVDLKAISKNEAEDIVLQGNDIVEVPSSTGKKILRGMINAIVPTISRLPVTVIR